MTANRFRAHRIAELNAAIHEIDHQIDAHRIRYPGATADEKILAAWRVRRDALTAQRRVYVAERTHLHALQASEGVPC